MGYYRARFDVVGIDIAPQPNYPFEFHQADALDWASQYIHAFAAVHASPPCQHYTDLAKGNNANQDKYPALIEPTRQLLRQTGLPYVIENVCGSPLIDPITLCGEMFRLAVIRHRLFESNVPLTQPDHIKHRGRVAGMRHGEWFEGPYFAVYGDGGGKGTIEQWENAMGIHWMRNRDTIKLNRRDIAEAIPPVYSEYVGQQLREHIEAQPSPANDVEQLDSDAYGLCPAEGDREGVA